MKPELFTGSLEQEERFRASLSPEQRETYARVFRERQEAAKLFRKVAYHPEGQRAAIPRSGVTRETAAAR